MSDAITDVQIFLTKTNIYIQKKIFLAVLRKQDGMNMCATLWIQAERGFFFQSDGMLG